MKEKLGIQIQQLDRAITRLEETLKYLLFKPEDCLSQNKRKNFKEQSLR